MLDSASAAIAGLIGVITLALSRCRCILRSTDDGATQWGIGFTDAQLFPDPRSKPVPPASVPGAQAGPPVSDGA